ncbi:Uncharacterized conserved membrane protein [Synechococcus sp. RCC307]|nr:Uncharacterized conserved membrane protein [Synechococcus sp. RCC307]
MDANAFQIIGFLLAAYSVVANDSLQTLGTYLSSNKGRTPKALQMLFICGVAAAVLLIGWFLHPAGGGLGDPAWGRLEKFPQPDNFTWVYLLPPIAVLALTQWGAPVSTSFLVLSAFEPKNATKLVLNSLSGYVMAFVLALVVYGLLMWILEKKVLRSHQEGTEVKNYWFALQWLSTGWLWSQWPMAGARHGQYLCLLTAPAELWRNGVVGSHAVHWPLRLGLDWRWSHPRRVAQQDQHQRSALSHGDRLPLWMRSVLESQHHPIPVKHHLGLPWIACWTRDRGSDPVEVE